MACRRRRHAPRWPPSSAGHSTAPGTFDANGWLTIGLAGHQPGIGERYISTGSLYLCAVAFLPLGLAADHAFWTGPDMPTTAMRAWNGQEFAIDHAISN